MDNTNIAKFLLILLMALNLTSCATTIQGKTQQVSIQSAPPGATVLIDGKIAGLTPMAVNLTRKHNHTVSLVKEGCEEQKFILKSQPSLVLASNLVPAALGTVCFAAASVFCMAVPPAGAFVAAGVITGGTCAGYDLLSGGGYTLSNQNLCIPMKQK